MITRLRFVDISALLALVPGSAHADRAAPASLAVVTPAVLQVARSDTSRPDSAKRKKASKPKVEVSGYLQVFYKGRRDVNGDGTEADLFRVQRARISFTGEINSHVKNEIDMDPRAPEVGTILRDAFVSVDYIPNHELRIGQQKTLFGYENPISSSRLFTVNRSEVSDNLSRGVNLRDLGVGLVGSSQLSDRFRIEDAITLVNGSGLNVQADSTHRKNIWGRIGGRYRNGGLTARFGVSGARGDQQEAADSGPPAVSPFTFTFTRVGTDVTVDHSRAFFAAEYVTGEDKAPASQPDAGGSRSGYYALIAAKTRWRAGPLLRYDALEDYRRWTIGGYAGLPSDDVSVLLNYEVFQDDLGKHDDRYYMRLQIRF